MQIRNVLLCFFLLFTESVMAEQLLRRGLGPEPDSIDIHQAQGLASINLLRDIREGLVTYDIAGEPVGGVASNWQVSDDGLTYLFNLRPSAKWSDGSPVLAEQFVQAWRKALSPQTAARNAQLLLPLENAQAVLAGDQPAENLGVEAKGQHQLEVRLVRPMAWWPEILAHPVSFPLRDGGKERVRDQAVNGAFVIEEWSPHAMIRLLPNPYYHSAHEVKLQVLEYLPIEDPAAELSRFRAGELDITESIPPGGFAWLEENLPEALRVHPYLGSFWLGTNMKRVPLSEQPDLRHALSLAIDREKLTRIVMGAGELPAWSLVPPGLEGYSPGMMPLHNATQAEREAEAKRLYQSEGFGPSRPLRVELRYNTSSQHRRMAVAVAAMWKQLLGVNTDLVNEEWKVFVNNRRQGVITQVFRGGWIADYADPTTFLDLFIGDNELNTSFYKNPAYDDLLAQAAELSGARRMNKLHEAESLLLEDMPVIPLYYYVSRHLVKPRVMGFKDNVRDIHLSRYMQMDTQ